MNIKKIEQARSTQSQKTDSKEHQIKPIMKQLKMEMGNEELHIQIRITGLWGKYYKLHVDDKRVTISALRWFTEIDPVSGNLKSDISTITSSFLLPCQVKDGQIWSDVIDGVLNIKIPVLNQVNKGFMNHNGSNYKKTLNNRLSKVG